MGQSDDYNFYPFKDSRGWGVKRGDGIPLFAERYDSVIVQKYIPFTNQIRVRQNEKWGVIDSMGAAVIPLLYPFIEFDRFGFIVKYQDAEWVNSTTGFLSFSGDTLVPFEHDFVSTYEVGNQGDFFIAALKDFDQENHAIYSSDGVRQTDYEFDVIMLIDSSRPYTFSTVSSNYYYGLHSLKTDKAGIYNGLSKRLIVPAIYDDVCVASCWQPLNPHFHPSSFAYTGTTPIFHMQLGDDLRMIDIHGNIIFSSKQFSGWDKSEKYYVNKEGVTRKVIGQCQETKVYLPPPYVMKDNAGYFLVDSQGMPHLDNKRFSHIEKFNLSKSQEAQFNRYIVDNEYHLKYIIDNTLKEIIPPLYVSIEVVDSNLICKRPNGTFDFYNRDILKLESDPRVIRPEHSYFYRENEIYVIKSKDGITLSQTNYIEHRQVSAWDSDSDTIFHILSDYSTSVDFYNERLEKIRHFDADNFAFISRFGALNLTLLYLYKKDRFSVLNLKTNEWILKEELCIPLDTVRANGESNSNLLPKLEHYEEKLYFWVYNLETGWNLINDKGINLFQWNRKTSGFPWIEYMNGKQIYVHQYFESGGEGMHYFATNNGSELLVKESLFDYRFVPEMNRVFVMDGSNSKGFQVYDAQFNFIEEINGNVLSLKNEPFYIHYDNDTRMCKIVSTEGIRILNDFRSITVKWDGIFSIWADSTIYLVTKFSTNSPRRYLGDPYDVTSKVFSCIREESKSSRRRDFYDLEGKLLFENYHLLDRSWYHDYFFVIQNDKEELWVTENGIVYHRNELPLIKQ